MNLDRLVRGSNPDPGSNFSLEFKFSYLSVTFRESNSYVKDSGLGIVISDIDFTTEIGNF